MNAGLDSYQSTRSSRESRLRVLQAAEIAFADSGYHGTSMRQVAAGAGVAQALIHYHFDTKQRLYAEVVAWRAGMINAQRMEALDRLSDEAALEEATLEEVLGALFRPALGDGAGGGAYARIMASLVAGGPLEARLVAEHYDAVAERFITAIERVCGLARSDAAWGYSLSIHVLVAGMARTGRTERLADEAEPADTDRFLERLVRFAAAGIANIDAREGV